MLENIKTEIVYYNIPTDFELEFNVSGCCNMRLLTSSVDDENKLLSVMARAIARSKIVIITGSLTNDIIENIAFSIGYETDTLDTEELFGTKSIFNEIIKGSVPLITEKAILGGCIVESGPQSLILLSSEKNVQREIMKNLIEPYIRAVSELEKDIEEGVTLLETPKTYNIDFVQNEPEETDTTSNEIDEPLLEVQQNTSQQFIIDENDISLEVPKCDNSKYTVATLIIMILLLLILGFLGYFLIVLPLLNDISIIENFKNIFSFLIK